jgi:hypothetical protein
VEGVELLKKSQTCCEPYSRFDNKNRYCRLVSSGLGKVKPGSIIDYQKFWDSVCYPVLQMFAARADILSFSFV